MDFKVTFGGDFELNSFSSQFVNSCQILVVCRELAGISPILEFRILKSEKLGNSCGG